MKRYRVRTVLGGLAVGCCLLARPGVAPAQLGSEAVVVFNARLPESADLARYYAQKRQVPTHHLFGFDLPESETISRRVYMEQLEAPLLAGLQAAGLWTLADRSRDQAGSNRVAAASIRYVVLCYGVPLHIEEDKALQEKEGLGLRPELRRTEASVDSQLAALPWDPAVAGWTGPLRNPGYAQTNASQLHPTQGILLVGRLDGPTVDLARGLVDRALVAETNGLWGRAYFDGRGLTNQPGLQQGDDWMRAGERLCRAWGFETELDMQEETFPLGKVLADVAVYAGWYASHASGTFGQAKVDFVPGAFAYHLHSFSAQTVRSTDFNWVGPLIHRGATATMGYVAEPYLAATADLEVFFSRWLFRQFTLGEAAWAAQNMLSWQTVVVGDPLYRPFVRGPQEHHQAMEATGSPLLAWSHLLVVNRNLVIRAPLAQMIRYLERLPLTRTSAVLTEKLGDLYWEQKQYRDALNYFDMALERNPTPTQKMALLLRLGRLRSFYGPEKKALGYYQTMVAEFPEYPDRVGLYEKMLPLARSVGDDDVVKQCEEALARMKSR